MLSFRDMVIWNGYILKINLHKSLIIYILLGSYSSYRGKATKEQIDQRNQIYGGLCILKVTDEDDEIIYEELSSGTYTVRPYILVNGQETEERVRKLAAKVDRDVGVCKTLLIPYNGITLMVESEFIPSIDGKLCRE